MDLYEDFCIFLHVHALPQDVAEQRRLQHAIGWFCIDVVGLAFWHGFRTDRQSYSLRFYILTPVQIIIARRCARAKPDSLLPCVKNVCKFACILSVAFPTGPVATK
jgi:hypothetical protein